MRGVILAGGRDRRLHPATLALPQALLPVYDKPVIHYPLSVLLSAGIRDIAVVAEPCDLPALQRLLGDGSEFGAHIGYAPREHAGVFASAADHIDGEPATVILGDQLFHGTGLDTLLRQEIASLDGCVVFGRSRREPGRHAVADVDASGRLTRIAEPGGSGGRGHVVAGLYLFDHDVVDVAKNRQHLPCADDETEIADVVRAYQERDRARLVELGRGLAWLDLDTCDALIAAGQYVRTLAHRQGLRIGELDTTGRTRVRDGEHR